MSNICNGCTHKKVCIYSEKYTQVVEGLTKDWNGRFKDMNSEMFVFCSLSTNKEYKQSNSSDCKTCTHRDLCKIYSICKSLEAKALAMYNEHLKSSLFCSEYALDDEKKKGDDQVD